MGSFTETVSSFGSDSLKLSHGIVIDFWKKGKRPNWQQFHRNYLQNKGTFLAKTKVKEQFHEKTRLNFLFYYATLSVEN